MSTENSGRYFYEESNGVYVVLDRFKQADDRYLPVAICFKDWIAQVMVHEMNQGLPYRDDITYSDYLTLNHNKVIIKGIDFGTQGGQTVITHFPSYINPVQSEVAYTVEYKEEQATAPITYLQKRIRELQNSYSKEPSAIQFGRLQEAQLTLYELRKLEKVEVDEDTAPSVKEKEELLADGTLVKVVKHEDQGPFKIKWSIPGDIYPDAIHPHRYCLDGWRFICQRRDLIIQSEEVE